MQVLYGPGVFFYPVCAYDQEYSWFVVGGCLSVVVSNNQSIAELFGLSLSYV